MQRNEREAQSICTIAWQSSRSQDARVVSSPAIENNIDSSVAWPTDKAIADALVKLSLKERERAYEDVHGISKPIDETPQMISDSMKKLTFELGCIKSKPAYDVAIQLSEKFVTDHAFRLSFLRADCYNATKAAARMVKYFETKKELFGAEMLTNSIAYEDLDSDTQQVVARGSLSILPARDTLGRYVFVSSTEHHLSSLTTTRTMSKAIWYFLCAMAEDEATQIKGMVVITYSVGARAEATEAKKKIWRALVPVGSCIPIRASSFHHCHDTSHLHFMVKIIIVEGGTSLCVRMRTHQGSHSECQYKLMTFGIPMRDFPATIEGQLKSAKHKGWLERRKQKERFLKTSPLQDGAVDLPTKFDVLLGKGMPCQEHPGNKLLHELVALRYEEYDGAKRDRKTEFAEELVKQVNRGSGRFLKRDDVSGMWVVVPLREARDKVCHGFRRKREWDLKKAKPPELSATSRVAMMRIANNEQNRQKRLKLTIEESEVRRT